MAFQYIYNIIVANCYGGGVLIKHDNIIEIMLMLMMV